MNPENEQTPRIPAPAAAGATVLEAPTTKTGDLSTSASEGDPIARLQALNRLGPPKPPGSSGTVSAPEYDHRDTFWIREDDLGPILDNLDASRVLISAFTEDGKTKISDDAIPRSAQLLIVNGPLSHDAGRNLTVKSATTQQILFVGELRYPIDLPHSGQVLLLLATPDDTVNTHITEPQIYSGRLVSQKVGRELEPYIRRELPLGEESLLGTGADSTT